MGERRGRTGRRRPRQTGDTAPAANAFQLAGPDPARPSLHYLDDGAIERIKARALDLLAEHGVAIVHEAGHDAMLRAGARPGSEANRVLLPQALVLEALAATPKQARLCGKRPDRDLNLPRGDGGFIMRTGTGAHGYVDPDSSAYRNLALTDVNDLAAVAEGLDQVGFIAHPFVHGVPETTADIHSLGALLPRTSKHCWIQPYAKENVEYLLRLAAIAAGGEAELRARPLASCIVCSFSPLEFKVMDVEALIQAGRAGLPVHACSLPSAGGTAPLTTPGLVLMATAEILAMVTLAHVLAPGTPVIATPLMFTLDMRTGSALQSCAESIQAAGMAIEVMKRGLGLLAHTYGAGSDTPDVDVQSAAERAMLGQAVALAGADILGGVGQLECATVFSPVQAVLDDEAGALIRNYLRPPAVDDAAFNWDEVLAIRTGGHFLDSPHTLAHCRTQVTPNAFLRQGRDDYENWGRPTAASRARDIALELVQSAPEEGYLCEDAVREMRDVVAAADRHILGQAKTHGKAEAV